MYLRPVLAAATSVEPLPGERVEDQGARRGGRLYELFKQLDGLLVRVCEVLVADLGAGDQVVRPLPGQLEAALGGEDDDLVTRGKGAFEVSHAVSLLIPYDHRLNRQAGKPQGVGEGLLHVPSCEAKYPPPAFHDSGGVVDPPDERRLVVLDFCEPALLFFSAVL